MRDDCDTATGPFMLLVEGAELPFRPDRRADTLDAIGGRVDELLTQEFGLSPEWVTGRAGYRYASIPAVCPQCGARLGFSTPRPDTANGALAAAMCQGSCGWTGSAVYRLIDLVAGTERPIRSAVAAGDLEPSYRSYWS